MSLYALLGLVRFSAPSSFLISNFNSLNRAFINRVSTRTQFPSYTTMASSMSSSPNTNKDVSEVAQQLPKITAPYGSWKSPITADVVTGASKRLGGTAVDGNGHLIWLESRPTESG